MRNIFGVLLMVAGVALGVYVGVWLMFIGGIVQVIEAIKASPVEALGIAIGVARVLGAAVVGVLTAVIAVLPGFAMLKT